MEGCAVVRHHTKINVGKTKKNMYYAFIVMEKVVPQITKEIYRGITFFSGNLLKSELESSSGQVTRFYPNPIRHTFFHCGPGFCPVHFK